MASAETPETEDVPVPPIDDARAELQAAVPGAAETIRELLDAEDERIQLRAAEAILDRGGTLEGDGTNRRNGAKRGRRGAVGIIVPN